jgi:hypothetical protein
MSRVYGKTTKKDKRLFLIVTLFAMMIITSMILIFLISEEIRKKPVYVNFINDKLDNGEPIDLYNDWESNNPERFIKVDMKGNKSILINGSVDQDYIITKDIPTTKNFTLTFNSTRSFFIDQGVDNKIGIMLLMNDIEKVFVGLKGENLYLNDHDLGEDLATYISYENDNTEGTYRCVYYSNPYIVISYKTFSRKVNVWNIGDISINKIALVSTRTSCEYTIIKPSMSLVKA